MYVCLLSGICKSVERIIEESLHDSLVSECEDLLRRILQGSS